MKEKETKKDKEKKREKKNSKNKKKGKTAWGMVAATFNTLALSFILVGYPVAIMPIYRAKTTTDGHRLVFVCFLHPIVHELTMTVQRSQSGKSYLLEKTVNDPKRIHFAMAVSSILIMKWKLAENPLITPVCL